MKVGIFGDSFACIPKKYSFNPTKSWPEIVLERYNTGSNCHGKPSTDLLYSVNKFKSYQIHYDKIIFVVTNPGRLRAPERTYEAYNEDDQEYINSTINLTSVEYCINELKNKRVGGELLGILEAARSYYIHLNDHHKNLYLHYLMLQDIKRIRSDVILIPAFVDSLPGYSITPMSEISEFEFKYWDRRYLKHGQDLRYCHMSADNNEIFAEHVFRWLNGEPVNIDIKNFVHPKTPKSYYFCDE